MPQSLSRCPTLIPVADGSEEMEVVIVADVLRRAGWPVTLAGIAGAGPIRAARGTRLVPDAAWSAVDPESFDLLVIPGGWEGVLALSRDARVLAAARAFLAGGRWVAAICAGPLVLQAAGLLAGRRVTCHPGVADKLTQTDRLADRVVIDGRLITSQGPGTALEFALALVGAAAGRDAAEVLARNLVSG